MGETAYFGTRGVTREGTTNRYDPTTGPAPQYGSFLPQLSGRQTPGAPMPSPRGDISPMPGQTTLPFGGVQATNPYAGGAQVYQDPSEILRAATQGYNELAAMREADTRAMMDPRAGAMVPGGGAPQAEGLDTWRFGSPSDIRRARTGGGTGGRGGYASTPAPGAPIPEFHFSGSLDLPDYQPPAEDDEFYKRERSALMGRGLRGLRNRTQEAIISSKSIDNPNARRQFVKDVLSGYGEGLEAVSAEAGREAKAEVGRKRAEEVSIYNAQYQAESQEAKANYDQQLQEELMNWQSAYQNAQAGYQNGAATAGTSGARAQWTRLPGSMGRYTWD